jgi:uncharacterized protein (TIGR02145 family)
MNPGPGTTIIDQTLTLSGLIFDSVIYHITPVINGCPGQVSDYKVYISPAPDVSLIPCFDVITNTDAKPFELKGALPLGGTFTGTGVAGSTFNPSNAGPGTHEITYTYINSFNCIDSAKLSITVHQFTGFTCGSMLTDIRDNNQYPTVLLGSQCWTASNLNYGSVISYTTPQRDNCLFEKYCFSNLAFNCQNQGGLYQWDEMMRYDSQEEIQGFCPPGWHIPAEHEWNTLFAFFRADSTNAVAGRYLKTGGGSGFNADIYQILHFNRVWNWNQQYQPGHSALQATFFWSSSPSGPGKARAHGMNKVFDEYNFEWTPSVSYYSAFRNNAFFLRCIKD